MTFLRPRRPTVPLATGADVIVVGSGAAALAVTPGLAVS